MIVELLAAGTALAATLFLGLRGLERSGAGQVRSKRAPRDAASVRTPVEITRAFTPLDLGVDPVRWPSERPWVLAANLPVPTWPSRSWNDEHFGKQWEKNKTKADIDDRGFHALAARRDAPPTESPTKVLRTSKGPPPAKPVGEPALVMPADVEIPTRAELEALIDQVGLAGAVQAVMQKTGWDSKRAVQALSKLRRSGSSRR